MKYLKKTLAVIMAVTMIMALLVSCGGKKVSKEDAEMMEGKWELVAYDYYGVKMLPEDEETYMSMEFNKNGKVTYTLDDDSEEYKWEKDDTLITIWVPEGAVSKGHTAVLDEDDYFTLYWNYEGASVKMIYAREGSDAANPDLYFPEDEITSTMLQQVDESNILEILEKMSPEAREAFEVTEIYDSLKEAMAEQLY